MPSLNTPLSDDELQQLDTILLEELDSEEGMTIDMMDGFMHALAIGPTTILPSVWLPKIWGTDSPMPKVESIERLNFIINLVMRHFNGIIAGLKANPPEVYPFWPFIVAGGEDKEGDEDDDFDEDDIIDDEELNDDGAEYDDASAWSYGFIEGMMLCWDDWQPMLQTPEGKAWFRPIYLLGSEEIDSEELPLIETPEQIAELSLQITDSLLNMNAYWLPYRKAVAERDTAVELQAKVGRNHPCPCGSGRKFRKCCGAAAELQ